MKTHNLIIGGTRGLGRELTRLMTERGDTVSVISRNLPDAKSSINGVTYRAADLTQGDLRRNIFKELVQQHGRISSLIFSHRYRGKDDPWKGEMETSVTATKDSIEELADSLDDQGRASIVMVSSVAGAYVCDGPPVGYHVAKAALDQMVRFYAVNLGRKGVRVNGVTPFTFLKEESKEFYLKDEKRLRMYQQLIPLGRMGTAEDVAKVILFLCSPDAGFVNGQNLLVDGGLSARWPESVAVQFLI